MNKRVDLRKRMINMAILALMILLSGCATSTKYGAAKISSTPAGAEVVNLKDNSHLGVTPVKVSFSGKEDTAEFVTVQLRKIGYLDRITTFWINRRHGTPLEADEEAIDIHVELERKVKNQ